MTNNLEKKIEQIRNDFLGEPIGHEETCACIQCSFVSKLTSLFASEMGKIVRKAKPRRHLFTPGEWVADPDFHEGFNSAIDNYEQSLLEKLVKVMEGK